MAASSLRRPSQSESAPEKTLVMFAVGLCDALDQTDGERRGSEHGDEINRQEGVNHLG